MSYWIPTAPCPDVRYHYLGSEMATHLCGNHPPTPQKKLSRLIRVVGGGQYQLYQKSKNEELLNGAVFHLRTQTSILGSLKWEVLNTILKNATYMYFLAVTKSSVKEQRKQDNQSKKYMRIFRILKITKQLKKDTRNNATCSVSSCLNQPIGWEKMSNENEYDTNFLHEILLCTKHMSCPKYILKK